MSSYTDKTYIVFLDLPQRIVFLIDKVRGKYSKSVKKWPAHITLKQDEDFKIESEKIVGILDKSLRNESCIEAGINKPKINYNDLGWNIYLPVKSRKLNKLIQKISKRLEPFIDANSPRAFISTKWEQSKEFYSHISIKGGKNKKGEKKILSKIINENFGFELPLKIKCCSVTLTNWDNGKWRKIKTIKLKPAR